MARICFPSGLITALRLILGMLFILSGGEKLLDLNYFELVIAEYQILPSLIIPAVALLVALFELLCGIMLLIDLFSRVSASLLLCMMAIFIAAMTNSLMRGLEHECGCFEFLSEWYGLKEEIGIGPILRDILFIILLLPVALRGSNGTPWKKSQGN
ncbi:MauE/DoxX family redox-associated membrane protein [Chlorobium sp. KB01]|uniref:MauE/DoxX family redox-associated membrane protein n=1 Tax=Chlorobium sp. KB01 TaxID=1917528 RepID=UPI000975641F|nr:MauE/DoxX family redox-associated membrane protein [Chlorobium sp. KB01]